MAEDVPHPLHPAGPSLAAYLTLVNPGAGLDQHRELEHQPWVVELNERHHYEVGGGAVMDWFLEPDLLLAPEPQRGLITMMSVGQKDPRIGEELLDAAL